MHFREERDEPRWTVPYLPLDPGPLAVAEERALDPVAAGQEGPSA